MFSLQLMSADHPHYKPCCSTLNDPFSQPLVISGCETLAHPPPTFGATSLCFAVALEITWAWKPWAQEVHQGNPAPKFHVPHLLSLLQPLSSEPSCWGDAPQSCIKQGVSFSVCPCPASQIVWGVWPSLFSPFLAQQLSFTTYVGHTVLFLLRAVISDL